MVIGYWPCARPARKSIQGGLNNPALTRRDVFGLQGAIQQVLGDLTVGMVGLKLQQVIRNIGGGPLSLSFVDPIEEGHGLPE